MRRTLTVVMAAVSFAAFTPVASAQSAAGGAAPEPPKSAPTQPPQRQKIYDEKADARRQIDDALARATRENRRVLIQWGANWCGWCHVLHNMFEGDKAIKRKLQYEYDVVLVDIGKWDKHIDVAKAYGADIKSVPYLTILNADGTPAVNQPTEPLEQGKGHDPKKILEFLTKHQAPYKSAAELLSAGLAEAARTDKKVFLHFGAPWCGWCHRLEDWMATETPTSILGADFIDVKIDVDRTVGGEEMMQSFTDGQRTGIPWFAFLDADGTPIVTSTARGSNIGCPYTDEEIAAFVAMIEKARTRITREQLTTLAADLTRIRKAVEAQRAAPAPAPGPAPAAAPPAAGSGSGSGSGTTSGSGRSGP